MDLETLRILDSITSILLDLNKRVSEIEKYNLSLPSSDVFTEARISEMQKTLSRLERGLK